MKTVQAISIDRGGHLGLMLGAAVAGGVTGAIGAVDLACPECGRLLSP